MIDGPYVEGKVHVVLAFLLEPNRASNTTVNRDVAVGSPQGEPPKHGRQIEQRIRRLLLGK